MPIRTGFSHAVMAVVLLSLWVSFSEVLSAVITQRQIVGLVERVARLLSAYTGIPISYGLLVTVIGMGLLTVLAFTWGYVFHRTRFE